MLKFILDGQTARIVRYVIRHTCGEETIENIALNDEQLAAKKTLLDQAEIKYTIETLDVSGIEWIEGRNFAGFNEVFVAIEMGETAFLEWERANPTHETLAARSHEWEASLVELAILISGITDGGVRMVAEAATESLSREVSPQGLSKIFARQVTDGIMDITDVPTRWREAVKGIITPVADS